MSANYPIKKPTKEQIITYEERENALRQNFLDGVLDIGEVLQKLYALKKLNRKFINCNGYPIIPHWATRNGRDGGPIVGHEPLGLIDPYTIRGVDVFKKGETVLTGEFIVRAQRVPGALNATALDFYDIYENWKYLPNEDIMLVFPITKFRTENLRVGVECLNFGGLGGGWHKCYIFSDPPEEFYPRCRVATGSL